MMIEIKPKNELIDKIFGIQEFDNNKSYDLSPYIISLPYKNVYLLHNTLTKQLCIITAEEYKQILNKVFTSDFKKELIENWYFFESDKNPKILVNQVRNFLKLTSKPGGKAKYTIFTTTACNARCFYCYQAGTPVHTMNEETALAVVEYIEKQRNGRPLYLRWFGGEPLCNKKVIDIICNKLIENGTAYTSTIVSNGYLFDKETCKKAKELWKLTDAQITIDGLEETYNKTKAYVYKNGESPFKIVLNNIQNLLDVGIIVDVRMNMDKHNFDELQSLINLLNQRFGENKHFNLYCRPLFENTGAVKNIRTDIERKELTDKFIEMDKYIDTVSQRPSYSLSNSIRLYTCMADNPYTCIISPEGKIGNCEHYPDSDFCGSVFNNDPIIPWDKYYPDDPECDSCVAYPDCRRLLGCNEHPECYEYERYIWTEKYSKGMQCEYDHYLKKKAKNS